MKDKEYDPKEEGFVLDLSFITVRSNGTTDVDQPMLLDTSGCNSQSDEKENHEPCTEQKDNNTDTSDMVTDASDNNAKSTSPVPQSPGMRA